MRLGNLIMMAALTGPLLASCATAQSGTAIDAAAVAAFTEGVSTRQEVEARMGRPASVTTTTDGKTILVYTHVVSHANGFTGRGEAAAQSVGFVFDTKGVLTHKTTAATNSAIQSE